MAPAVVKVGQVAGTALRTGQRKSSPSRGLAGDFPWARTGREVDVAARVLMKKPQSMLVRHMEKASWGSELYLHW